MIEVEASGIESVPESSDVGEVTGLLRDWAAGDEAAGERVIDRLYRRLRRVAAQQLARENGAVSVEATDLVHEAYLRLQKSPGNWNDRGHFCAACGRLIRLILVDRARRRQRPKHGGGRLEGLNDERQAPIDPEISPDLVSLDAALDRLAAVDEVAARVVTLRYFSGLTIEETASGLGLGRATVIRKWRVARAWLREELEAPPV